MSEQPPWQPPQPPAQAWPPANPYGYPPPANPYGYPPPSPYGYPPQNRYGYPPPSRYSYAPTPPVRRGRSLLIGGVVVALVLTVAGVGAALPRSSTSGSSSGNSPTNAQPPASSQPQPGVTSAGVTATSTLSQMSGVEVYADDFTDPTSGWWKGTDPKGAVYAYSSDGYTVTSAVRAHWLSYAPYSDAAQQINMTT